MSIAWVSGVIVGWRIDPTALTNDDLEQFDALYNQPDGTTVVAVSPMSKDGPVAYIVGKIKMEWEAGEEPDVLASVASLLAEGPFASFPPMGREEDWVSGVWFYGHAV